MRIRFNTTAAPVIFTSCLLHGTPARAQNGQWKESPIFHEMVGTESGEPKEDLVRVWDSHPELRLKFSWSGGVNAQHEAEGLGVLTWSKQGSDHEEKISEYTGEMKNGMREGRGTLYLSGGATYRGNWAKNVKSGEGIYFYANGDSYEGQFLNDLMHGHGTYADADGTTYVGEFVNDKRQGRGTITLLNGEAYESDWVDGVETGDSINRRSLSLAKGAPKYQVRVTLDHSYMQGLEKKNEAESALLYRSRMVKQEMVIQPNLTLLDRWRESGHVDVTTAIGLVGFSIGPVPLILALDNTGEEAITVQSGRLEVQQSTPDLEPIIVFYGADLDSIAFFFHDREQDFMRFGLSNLGEGTARNCTLEFNISPIGAPSGTGGYTFKKHLGDMEERIAVDLREECASLGVDVAKLLAINSGAVHAVSREAARKMLGPFARFDSKGKWIESNGRLNALLSYDWIGLNGSVNHAQTELNGLVVIDPRTTIEFGAPAPVQGDYNLLLALHKSNYSMPFPFRKRLPPGGNARFRIHLCAPRNSNHYFQVVLKSSDGSERRSAPIQMHYFLPRGDTHFIESGKAEFPNP